ncbi:intracellular protease, PfpI family [Ostertagia ostertagi]
MGSATELLDDLSNRDEAAVTALFAQRKSGLEKLRARFGDQAIGYRADGGHELISERELYAIDKLDYLNRLLQPVLGFDAFTLQDKHTDLFGFNRKVVKTLIQNNSEGGLHSGMLMRALLGLCGQLGIEVKTEVELTDPLAALREEGAVVDIVSSKTGEVKGWAHTDWGKTVTATHTYDQLNAADYDAVVLPGGVMNPDKLRTQDAAVRFVKNMAQADKPVAAICHGPQTLIEAGVLDGKTMTSYPSLQTDLRNAGANWVDEEVVQDGYLITSRNPDDLPAFNKKIIDSLS